MARDDAFEVRSTSFPPVAEGQGSRAVVNRIGMQVVVDFLTQLALSGFTYHVQFGTEDAGVAFTTAIDDELAAMVIDNATGYALMPLLFEVTPGVIAGATLAQAMLEMDKAKLRFSTVGGGGLFVPENLNGSDRNTYNGTCAVGVDVVVAAKSAVPNSVELARQFWLEDALANTIGYPGAWNAEVYSVAKRPLAVAIDASALVGHVGSASADMTGYAVLQVAQVPKSYIVAT